MFILLSQRPDFLFKGIMSRNILYNICNIKRNWRNKIYREGLQDYVVRQLDSLQGCFPSQPRKKELAQRAKMNMTFLVCLSILAAGVFKTGSRGQQLSEPKSLDSGSLTLHSSS